MQTWSIASDINIGLFYFLLLSIDNFVHIFNISFFLFAFYFWWFVKSNRRPKNTSDSTTRNVVIRIRNSTVTPTTLSGRRPPPSRMSYTSCTNETKLLRPCLRHAALLVAGLLVALTGKTSNVLNTGAFTISFTAMPDGKSFYSTLCATSTLTAWR